MFLTSLPLSNPSFLLPISNTVNGVSDLPFQKSCGLQESFVLQAVKGLC